MGRCGISFIKVANPIQEGSNPLANHSTYSNHGLWGYGFSIEFRGGGGEGRHERTDHSRKPKLCNQTVSEHCYPGFYASPLRDLGPVPGAKPLPASRGASVSETGIAAVSSSDTTASCIKGSPENLKQKAVRPRWLSAMLL